jgi:hypothetical protein
MRWVGHVAFMRDMTIYTKFVVEKYLDWDYMGGETDSETQLTKI